MAMNFGVGALPKKKGAPPPPFGGGRGGSPAKAAPPFASGGGADQRGAAIEEEAPPAAPGKAAAPLSLPGGRGSDSGGIAPEAVCYRTEMETCGGCEYNEGGECSKLSIPVSDGDGCNLFSARGGEGEPAGAEAMEEEPAVAPAA